MKIDRSGVPFIAVALAPAAVLLVARQPWWAAPFAALAAFFAYFFRDPDRDVPRDPGAVVSPADGRVLVAGPADEATAPAGRWQQVSVFLSPFDVHVNRIPIGGRVTRVDYRPGRFLSAYRREAAGENERTEIWIDQGGWTVVCRQVVGVLARRIVCRIAPGATVETGQRFGIMKFGSRMDIFVPRAAVVRVARGDRVRGGETILAVLPAIGGARQTGEA